MWFIVMVVVDFCLWEIVEVMFNVCMVDWVRDGELMNCDVILV